LRGFFLSALLLLSASSLFCQIPQWLEPFFLEGGIHRYFAPGELREYLRPEWGFRGGLGYEWRRFRFSAETGFSRVTGTHSQVLHLTGLDIILLDITAVPLLFKAGYTVPLIWGFGLKPEAGLGLLFSKAGYYSTVLDLLLDKRQEASVGTFFSALRLDLTYTAPGDFITVYAGGGFDLIIETVGGIPLPFFQAGLSLKPFALAARAAARRGRRQIPPPFVPEPQALAEPQTLPEPLAEPGPEIEMKEEVPEPEPEAPVRIMRVLYFPPNMAVPVQSHLVELDAAGEALREFPDAKLTLRGYTAPYGRPEQRLALSEERVRFCADYLARTYGIPDERIGMEWYGADKAPAHKDGTDWRMRCVEIIVE
jgi:outer membrane protein OmpA-like peptidoglycan-associated protein